MLVRSRVARREALPLRDQLTALFENQFVFATQLRIGIKFRSEVPISLQQLGCSGAKLRVVMQALSYRQIGKVGFADELSLFGGFASHPMLQLNHQSGIGT